HTNCKPSASPRTAAGFDDAFGHGHRRRYLCRAGALIDLARRDQNVSSAGSFDESSAGAAAASSGEQAETLAGEPASERRSGADRHDADFRRGPVDETGNPE